MGSDSVQVVPCDERYSSPEGLCLSRVNVDAQKNQRGMFAHLLLFVHTFSCVGVCAMSLFLQTHVHAFSSVQVSQTIVNKCVTSFFFFC